MAQGISKATMFESLFISYTTHNLPQPTTSPNEPVLVFVHGWCCASSLWSSQSPLYSTHPSLLIDLPGHGNSSKPENVDYSIELLARSIKAVLDVENITQIILIGHSLGGVVCTMLLRLYGPYGENNLDVTSIIYISSFFLAPAHYLPSSVRKTWAGILEDDAHFFAMFDSGLAGSGAAGMAPVIVEQVRDVMVNQTPLHVRLSSVGTNAIPHHWKWEEVYEDVPMLHVTYAGSPSWGGQAERHFPALKTEVWEGVGVFLFMERAVEFNERVEWWLGEVRGGMRR